MAPPLREDPDTVLESR